MPETKYRTILYYDGDKHTFVARAPELEHCQAEGASRAEALTRLEEEMEAQIRNMREHGGQPPAPVDAEEFSGELTAQVSRSLHRELVFQARAEGVEVAQLVSELLAAALEGRRGARAGSVQRRPPAPDADGNDGRGRREQLRGGFGSRYHGIMDDRANFIEYVRALDHGPTPVGAGSAGRRRRRRGHGGPNGGGPGPGT